MSVSNESPQSELQLPRDVTQYRHTIHSKQQYKDTRRMVHDGIIREAIESGDLKPDDKKSGYAKFSLQWASFTYELVVPTTPERDGIYPIVTIYHNFSGFEKSDR